MSGTLRGLRSRAANCSVRAAFALYAAVALLAALALSFVVTGLLGLLANSLLPVDPYAYSGTYVYDARKGELVPAIFVACLVIAGRRFYRSRLAGPIAAMDDAARRIAANDLDFRVRATHDDELGRLCGQFEAMRAELARTEGELWRAAESRRQVNAAFAHDLRTPLTVVRGQAELIARIAGRDDVRAAAAAIVRQAERLSDFADSMRGLDALEAAEVDPAPLDPAAWVREAAADAREVVRDAGCGLVVASAGLPPLVMADGRALSRIADNLVANAARYARSEVGVSLSWADGELELVVTDDGPGFGDVALKRAAEPFWGESKGAGGHLGLGLYVARLLAEKHGGSLELARAEGGARSSGHACPPRRPRPWRTGRRMRDAPGLFCPLFSR